LGRPCGRICFSVATLTWDVIRMAFLCQTLPWSLAALITGAAAYSQIDDSPPEVSKLIGIGAGSEGLELKVRTLGFVVNGAHVVGHLATLANPAGHVSLVLPPAGCGSLEKVTVTSQAHRPRCKFAVNAGLFNATTGACIGNVVSQGVVIQTVPLSQGNVNFGIKDGRFHIGYVAPENTSGFVTMVSGMVWLVRDGKNNVRRGWIEANTTVQSSGTLDATNAASRTAIGWDRNGGLMIVQIDGSNVVGLSNWGMDMSTLADNLIKLGAVEAINLDGGSSSAMAVDGQLINYPSDVSCDASGLYKCERPVSTVLCIHEQKKPGAGDGQQKNVATNASKRVRSPTECMAMQFYGPGCASFDGCKELYPLTQHRCFSRGSTKRCCTWNDQFSGCMLNGIYPCFSDEDMAPQSQFSVLTDGIELPDVAGSGKQVVPAVLLIGMLAFGVAAWRARRRPAPAAVETDPSPE